MKELTDSVRMLTATAPVTFPVNLLTAFGTVSGLTFRTRFERLRASTKPALQTRPSDTIGTTELYQGMDMRFGVPERILRTF